MANTMGVDDGKRERLRQKRRRRKQNARARKLASQQQQQELKKIHQQLTVEIAEQKAKQNQELKVPESVEEVSSLIQEKTQEVAEPIDLTAEVSESVQDTTKAKVDGFTMEEKSALCQYEAKRLRRMEENKKMLLKLNIPKFEERPRPRQVVEKKVAKKIEPVRRSRRQQKQTEAALVVERRKRQQKMTLRQQVLKHGGQDERAVKNSLDNNAEKATTHKVRDPETMERETAKDLEQEKIELRPQESGKQSREDFLTTGHAIQHLELETRTLLVKNRANGEQVTDKQPDPTLTVETRLEVIDLTESENVPSTANEQSISVDTNSNSVEDRVSNSEDSEDDAIENEYEAKRQRRIEQNRRVLLSLNIPTFTRPKPKPQPKKIVNTEPVRRSTRSQFLRVKAELDELEKLENEEADERRWDYLQKKKMLALDKLHKLEGEEEKQWAVELKNLSRVGQSAEMHTILEAQVLQRRMQDCRDDQRRRVNRDEDSDSVDDSSDDDYEKSQQYWQGLKEQLSEQGASMVAFKTLEMVYKRDGLEAQVLHRHTLARRKVHQQQQEVIDLTQREGLHSVDNVSAGQKRQVRESKRLKSQDKHRRQKKQRIEAQAQANSETTALFHAMMKNPPLIDLPATYFSLFSNEADKQQVPSSKLKINVDAIQERFLGTQILPTGKEAVMEGLCPNGYTPEYVAESDVQMWSDTLVLFMSETTYEDVFVEDQVAGRKAVYFDWNEEQSYETPVAVLLRLKQVHRGDEQLHLDTPCREEKVDKNELSGTMLLFVQHRKGPYIYCGRLGSLGHHAGKFRWQLLDVDAFNWTKVRSLLA